MNFQRKKTQPPTTTTTHTHTLFLFALCLLRPSLSHSHRYGGFFMCLFSLLLLLFVSFCPLFCCVYFRCIYFATLRTFSLRIYKNCTRDFIWGVYKFLYTRVATKHTRNRAKIRTYPCLPRFVKIFRMTLPVLPNAETTFLNSHEFPKKSGMTR